MWLTSIHSHHGVETKWLEWVVCCSYQLHSVTLVGWSGFVGYFALEDHGFGSFFIGWLVWVLLLLKVLKGVESDGATGMQSLLVRFGAEVAK